MPNFWDTYYGGGYGVGQNPGASPSTPYGGYQPPKSAGQPQSSTNSGSSWGDTFAGLFGGAGGSNALDWARLGYAVYQDRNPRAPKFEQPPLTPEQKQLWDLYLKGMMNPALKDNASNVNSIGQQVLSGYQGMSWQAPKNKDGSVAGYAGSNTSFIPPFGQPNPTPAPTTPQPGMGIQGGNVFGGSPGVATGEGGLRQILHKTQDPGLMGMSVSDEIEAMRGGMFNDPMNQVHAGNASGDPNWAPTPWPAGTGPNQQPTKPIKSPWDAEAAGPSPATGPVGGDPESKFQGFVDFLNSQGVKNAAQIAVGFFMGGLPGAMMATARMLYSRWQSSNQPAPAGGKP